MKNKTPYIILLLILFSCEKLALSDEFKSQDPYVIFDYMWQVSNDKYAYFDLKKIDWDEIGVKYRTRLHPDMSEEELFNVLGTMLTELKDDHTNLRSNFNYSRFGVRYTAQDNFDWRIVVDQYLTPNFFITGPFRHDFINNTKIGYVRLSSFSNTLNSSHLNFIMEKYQDANGLIIDIRENGGGLLSNVYSLLERFIDEKTKIFYTRIKTGAKKNDFSPIEPVYLEPYNGIKYLKKVALLTDRGSYSASSFTALASNAIPKLIRIGDTTGGGLGVPNGGQLPNGWSYRFSISQTLSLDQKPDFEMGVPPDIFVSMDWNNREQDEILEKAIRFFLN